MVQRRTITAAAARVHLCSGNYANFRDPFTPAVPQSAFRASRTGHWASTAGTTTTGSGSIFAVQPLSASAAGWVRGTLRPFTSLHAG
jgi:hypothetical protein